MNQELPERRSNWLSRIHGLLSAPIVLYEPKSEEERNVRQTVDRFASFVGDPFLDAIEGMAGTVKNSKDILDVFDRSKWDEIRQRSNRISDWERPLTTPREQTVATLTQSLGLSPHYLSGQVTDNGKVNIGLSAADSEKVFHDAQLEVPELIRNMSRYSYEQPVDLILDPDDKEGVGKRANELRAQGYQRVESAVWSNTNKKWKEIWRKPQVLESPDVVGEVDARLLRGAIVNSVRKGKVPQNIGEVGAKITGSFASAIPTAGASIVFNPAIEETGGIFQAQNDFEAVLNTLEFASPPFAAIFGPADAYIKPMYRQFRASGRMGGLFKHDYKSAYGLKAYDPAKDLDQAGESYVRTRQFFIEGMEIEEEQADILLNYINLIGNYKNGDPHGLVDNIIFQHIDQTAANSMFEQMIDGANMFAPEGYLFKVSDSNKNDVLGFKHNFDSWLDFIDSYDGGHLHKSIFDRSTRTFSKQGLHQLLHSAQKTKRTNRDVPVKDLYGEFSGLRLYTEELEGLGINRFIDSYQGDRIPLTGKGSLKEYMDVNRVKITEMYIPSDPYAEPLIGYSMHGAREVDGVVLLKLDVPSMNPDSHLRRTMESGSLETDIGHYGRDLDQFGNDTASIRGTTRELLDGKVVETAIPRSARTNIFVTGRYSLRKVDGELVFHIDELQSDLFQNVLSLSKKEVDSLYRNMWGDVANTASGSRPLYWIEGVTGSEKAWHAGTLRMGEREREVAHLPTGESVPAYADAIHVTPANTEAATRESVERKFDDILDEFRNEGRVINEGSPERPLEVRYTKQDNTPRDVEPLIVREAEIRSQDTDQTWMTIQILEHAEDSQKSPVIRIVQHLAKRSEPEDFDENIEALGKVLFGNRKRSTIDPTQLRYSADDLVSGKAAPYSLKKLTLEEGTFYEVLENTASGKRAFIGAYRTPEEAAKALSVHLKTVSGNDFPLPPDFLFHSNNFHIPILRRLLFHGAAENAAHITLSDAADFAARYGDASLPYRERRYGNAGTTSGSLPSGVLNIVTDIMHTAGWSKWSIDDSKKLFTTFDMPIGTMPNSHPNVGKRIETLTEAINDMYDDDLFDVADYRLLRDDIDHLPYELKFHEYEKSIRDTLDNISVNQMAELISQQLRKYPRDQELVDLMTLTRSLSRNSSESLKELQFLDSAITHSGYREVITDAGLPELLQRQYRRRVDSEGISILTALESFGITSSDVRRGTKKSILLENLIELALETNPQKVEIEDTVGLKDLAILEVRATNKTKKVHRLGLRDDLTDPKTRETLGITTRPDDGSYITSLGEALTTVEQRLFQLNGDTPRGGKVLGFTDFVNDGKYIINLTRAANFRTAVHEVGHVFRRQLDQDQLDVAGRFAMGDQYDTLVNKNIWTRQGEEAFAEAFETYMLSGYAPNAEVRGVFEQFKVWMTNLMRSIKGSPHEENLNPQMRELFDDVFLRNKPSVKQIEANVPVNLVDDAKKFYGYRVDKFIVADDGSIPPTTPLFQAIEEPEIKPIVEELDPLTTVESRITANFVEDNFRKIATMPGIRHVLKRFNATVAAFDPLSKALIVGEILKVEGDQKSQLAFARLARLGSQGEIFGQLDDNGLIAEGALKGLTVNTVRTNHEKYAGQLTAKQKEWVETAQAIEEAKLRMFKAEGIDIKELSFEEGGHYAGRRVFAKIFGDGEIMEAVVSTGGRGKSPQEKRRIFETPEEGIAAGFRYLDDDESLMLNLQSAYKRVAEKRMTDHIINNVVWTRTTAVTGDILPRRAIAKARKENVEKLINELQRAKRGGQIHVQTRKAIEKMLPEVGGMLDDVSQITLEQIVNAGRVAADQPITFVPQGKAIRALFVRVKELEDEIALIKASGVEVPSELVNRLAKMNKKLFFQKHAMGEAYKTWKETGTFEYTFQKSATSIIAAERVGAIDELMEIVRGVRYQTPTGQVRYRGGLKSDVEAEWFKVNSEFLEAQKKLAKPGYAEGTLTGSISSFGGRIFKEDQPLNLGKIRDKQTGEMRQMKGLDVQERIADSMIKNQEFSQFLEEINTVNSALRFFQLAGDMSLFGIQLLFLMGHAVNPIGPGGRLTGQNFMFLPRAIRGFVHGFIDPTVHQKVLDNNRPLLARHPGMMLSAGGTEMTEFTRRMANSGFVRAKPIKLGAEVLSQVPGVPQAGRAYVGFLKRAQTGFETALDIAGIEMAKALDHKAVDDISTQQVDDFINEFRGLANTQRLGTSAKQRQYESLALLAPRYNRAIVAMLADVFRGGIRGSQAREKIASAVAAISALTVAIGLARGEDPDEIAEHFDPRSPMFFTFNIDGVNIGVGSKVRSLIKLSTQIYLAVEDGREADLWDFSMDNPGIRFLRGNLSPLIGTGIDAAFGRTYMGEPVWGNGWDIPSHAKNFAMTELLPKTMPIWAQATLLEGGGISNRMSKGTAEFFGGRGYPESSYQLLQKEAETLIGIPYEDMEPFERKLLRELLKETLDPMMAERIERGDKTAQYWDTLIGLNNDRIRKEEELLKQYYNPRQFPEFLVGGASVLRREFGKIQNWYAGQRATLNEQYEMYQDDVEFDPEDPEKFILQEWYGLFEKAQYAETGVFDNNRLERLKLDFWNKKLPDGTPYRDYSGYVYRNTSTAEHPEGYAHLLGRTTVERWRRSERMQSEFLENRGKWKDVLDKQP